MSIRVYRLPSTGPPIMLSPSYTSEVDAQEAARALTIRENIPSVVTVAGAPTLGFGRTKALPKALAKWHPAAYKVV